MNRLGGFVVLLLAAVMCFAQDAGSDKDVAKLILGDYTFQKVHDAKEDVWTILVSREGKTARRFGEALQPHWLSMELVHLLGLGSQQVLLEEYSGGAHCCSTYWIADAAPDLRMLLDTGDAEMHGIGSPVDIDGDGNSEMWSADTTFDYFHGPYAWSPQTSICFSYDQRAQQFIPANDLCFPDAKKDIDSDIAALASGEWRLNAEPKLERQRLILSVVIAYLYAGHDREAWEYYDQNYQEADREKVKVELLDAAKHDPFYHQMEQRYHGANAR